MPFIYYTHYSFLRPQTPLSEVDYEKFKRMGAADFEEYLSAVSSASWSKFREDHSAQIKMVVWGGLGGLLAAVIFQKVDVIGSVAILGLLVGFLAGCSLLLSASTHMTYIEGLKNFFKGRREMIVLSDSYEEYVGHEARSKN